MNIVARIKLSSNLKNRVPQSATILIQTVVRKLTKDTQKKIKQEMNYLTENNFTE